MSAKISIEGKARIATYEQAQSEQGFAACLETAKKQEQAGKFFNALYAGGKKTVVLVSAGEKAGITLEMKGEPEKNEVRLFYFGENSHATLFVKSGFSKSYSEARGIFLGRGAEAHCCFLQEDGKTVDADVVLLAKLGEGAKLKLINSNLGAEEKNDNFVILQDERGSRVEHFEASLAKGKQRFFKNSDHLHIAPDTFSRSIFRYATAGDSRVEVDGKVTIEQSAPGSDTHLLAKSLLLSENSTSKVIPMLFVRNAEVAAGHGSAMTPLQDEELFYLRSRGIGESESRLLVLQGFLNGIVSKSEIDAGMASALGKELDADSLKIFPRD